MKTQRLMCVCHRKWRGCMRSEKMTKYPVSCVCVHYTTLVRPCSGARKTQRLCGIGNGEVAGEVRK